MTPNPDFHESKYLFCVEKTHSLHRLEERLEDNCLTVSSNIRWHVLQFSLFVGKKKMHFELCWGKVSFNTQPSVTIIAYSWLSKTFFYPFSFTYVDDGLIERLGGLLFTGVYCGGGVLSDMGDTLSCSKSRFYSLWCLFPAKWGKTMKTRWL